MTLPDFAYVRPDTVEQALALLAEDGAMALAGGQSLVALLAERQVAPRTLVDLGRLAELRHLETQADCLWVGAGVSLATLAAAASVPPLLREAIASVGSPPVRNRATLAGNLIRANPTSELPVAAVALGARLVLCGPAGRREVPADGFFLAPYITALVAGELVLGVSLPHSPAPCTGSAFAEIALRAGAPPLIAVAACIETDQTGIVTAARLVAGGITGVPQRCPRAEAALLGRPVAEAVSALAGAAQDRFVPSPELEHAAYAGEVLPVVLRRAVTAAAARASGNGADSP